MEANRTQQQSDQPVRRGAPHESDAPLIISRRGQMWIPGEVVEGSYGTVQRGPLYAEWEFPENVRFPIPVVLVHGGGGQGTDWLTTPDGRPGWATRLVQAGFVVYVIDRPGHGRSPYHPDVIGEMGPPFPYEAANGLFFSDENKSDQHQWTYARSSGTVELDGLMSAMGPLPKDLAESHRMDGDRLARLLDRIGPAVLITHSAGAPAGWMAADARPGLVEGIVAVEPLGPPFGEFPGIGRLDWGLTAAPITYSSSFESAADAENARADELEIPAFNRLPISVVTGEVSGFAAFADQMVEFLHNAGASADWVHLPDSGISGNGHGLIFESNSDEIVRFVEVEIIRKMIGPEQRS